MSILELHSPDTLAAMPARIDVLRPEPKFSAWSMLTAATRGVAAAGAEISASALELLQPFGATMGRLAGETPADDMARRMADEVRTGVREGLAPNPEDASAAEQVLYGFARGASKVVFGAPAGLAGFALAGGEEALTATRELQRQGVDDSTALKAGAVQGAGLALAALPLAGRTLAQTAGLYLAGGPGGFVAQQALTREILKQGGYDQIAEGYDPLDPVGLAVSALVPAVFTAAALRGQRRAATVSREAEDAARVLLQAEQRQASNPAPEVPRSADAHDAALARAEDAVARGEPVQVADVAPRITPEQRDANFREWFGGSKVVDESGAPLVVYHVTPGDFDSFRTEGNRTNAGDRLDAAFFTDSADYADAYAAEKRGQSPATMPAFVSMRNPLIVDADARMFADPRYEQPIIQRACEAGHDGFIFRDAETGAAFYAAFRPEQIKSAIGNSGRFDPSSPSLTDPIYQLGAAVRELSAAVDEARGADPPPPRAPEDANAPRAAEAPTYQAGAPARGDGAASPDPVAADAGGAVETPGAAAEQGASAGRLDQVRAQFPDLMVQLDDMAAPMRLDDFLAAVKAEADELAADAPLMQVAAECALLNGTA